MLALQMEPIVPVFRIATVTRIVTVPVTVHVTIILISYIELLTCYRELENPFSVFLTILNKNNLTSSVKHI